MARIDIEKIKRAKQRFVIFTISSIVSFGAFLFTLQYAVTEFAKSEFTQYFSLIFSDSQSVFVYWKEFSLVLAESLPVMSILLLLSISLVMVYFLKKLLKDFGVIHYKPI
jgi:hypothetical protein